MTVPRTKVPNATFEQEVEDNRDWHLSCEMPDGTTDLQEKEQKFPQYTSLRSYVICRIGSCLNLWQSRKTRDR